MSRTLFLLFFLGMSLSSAFSQPSGNCESLVLHILNNENQIREVITNSWTREEKDQFLVDLKHLDFTENDRQIIIKALNLKKDPISVTQVKNYLGFVLSLSDKERKYALTDIDELYEGEVHSRYITRFFKSEEKIQKKIKLKDIIGEAEQERFKDLYYGCRAYRPNEVNKAAARDFKRFNYALSLGTLAVSYTYYNWEKEKTGEWYGRLAYDIGISIFFSYVGGIIQTKQSDIQLVKSLKNYFFGRIMGLTDLVVYDPIFNHEHSSAEKRIEDLKKDPNYQKEVQKLLEYYKKRGAYRKFKEEILYNLKKLPEPLSLGIKGQSIDEHHVDWNNLSHADLDRPEVQDVLVAAAMQEYYEQVKGQWIDTSDIGVDRYAFNTVFFAGQIPVSIGKNYLTYQILCMGQDNPKVSFLKATLFNVVTSAVVNQFLFDYRKKSIGN